MKRSSLDIPLYERYCLTVEEAAAYTLIGENRLREIIKDNPESKWILWVGNICRIKRKEFEMFLDNLSSL